MSTTEAELVKEDYLFTKKNPVQALQNLKASAADRALGNTLASGNNRETLTNSQRNNGSGLVHADKGNNDTGRG